MKSTAKVHISDQVHAFRAALHPEHRQKIRLAVRELTCGRGDVRALNDSLAGFYRLRVGRYRIIFRYRSESLIELLYIAERRLVYELFAAEFAKRLMQ